MGIYTTPDGRYTIAIETEGEGDGNTVVYDRMVPVWDRFSYENGLGEAPAPKPGQPDVPPPISPEPPTVLDPLPIAGPRFIRVTNEQDGRIAPRMMSYWANAWVDADNSIVVFFGSHETGGPQFIRVGPAPNQIQRLGDLGLPFGGETEGWYWDREGYLYLFSGTRFMRVHPFRAERNVIYDISMVQGIPRETVLWQPHSSDDGQVHSATVLQVTQSGPYGKIGTVVRRQGGEILYYPAQGVLDESAITTDGVNLIIKESYDRGFPQLSEDNRIINLSTKDTRYILDRERAMGHSDCGSGWMVGEADKPDPGMCGWWDLRGPVTPERFHPLFETLNMGYVAVRGERILHSSPTQLRLVDRQTGAISTLMDHGGGVDYDDRVKANLSPCGRVACFMSSFGGPRRDVYLLVL